ncbi:hypothetical protein [Burkholderia contaminans]|uniref:PIN domain-containing protein n=1 Tax=Burkholderia contaminans TaxID=488447 RepID=A0A3N8RBZ3_9BURK|nr:hypothetical protein [Burkholderia contaminans]RQT33417.1 hypothetical protein DF037_07470 [Burkholderia contaminans]
MAINLTVAADVIDITRDTPRAEDCFFVDTNVWYWVTYTKATATGAQAYQTTNYPRYTQDALAAGSTIYQSGLSLAELSHLIEKSEREIYAKANGMVNKGSVTLRPKEFRHNFPTERASVCSEVTAACAQVTTLANSLAVTIDGPTASAFMARIPTDAVDGYDLYILESMQANGVTQVITDDGDFATIPGIRVFTANRNVITAATNQGKLVIR